MRQGHGWLLESPEILVSISFVNSAIRHDLRHVSAEEYQQSGLFNSCSSPAGHLLGA